MKKITYDFSRLENAVSALKQNPRSTTNLNRLKTELNKLFKDSRCIDVIYTLNTDSVFFGMCVMPKFDSDEINEILSSDEKKRITQYYLEIDSKLFEINLTTKEIVAVILHEVGHVVNDSTPIDETRKIMDAYLAEKNDHLVLSDAVQYKDLLSFAIKDTVRKITSIFEKDDDEILADRFCSECGYGLELENALTKIIRNARTLNRGVKNKLIVLQWTLRLYKDVKHNRIPALQTLRKANDVEGSVLVKREINLISRRLNEIDDDFMLQESTNFIKKITKKFKYSGMKMFEEEFYELSLEAKNVSDTDETLIVIRKINTRISLLHEYLENEELDDKERERWLNLLEKYEQLRSETSKKKTAEKYLGLFVYDTTPKIKSRYDY